MVSILFYVTFTLAVPMIMIQLFAAVVIENFEKQQEMEEWSLSPALLEVGLVCSQPVSGTHNRLEVVEAQQSQPPWHRHLCQPLCSAVQLLQLLHNMASLCSLCSSKLGACSCHVQLNMLEVKQQSMSRHAISHLSQRRAVPQPAPHAPFPHRLFGSSSRDLGPA